MVTYNNDRFSCHELLFFEPFPCSPSGKWQKRGLPLYLPIIVVDATTPLKQLQKLPLKIDYL